MGELDNEGLCSVGFSQYIQGILESTISTAGNDRDVNEVEIVDMYKKIYINLCSSTPIMKGLPFLDEDKEKQSSEYLIHLAAELTEAYFWGLNQMREEYRENRKAWGEPID